MHNPRKYPLSWSLIRNFTERFQWQDPTDGSLREGFNPPRNAIGKQRKPYDICFVTRDGRVDRGRCVTLTVRPQKHQRMVKFVGSDEIRLVYDYLIVSVDDQYFRTH